MNVAERFLEYYESEALSMDCAYLLGEDTHSCIEQIQRIARTIEFEEWYGNNLYLSTRQAESVLSWWISQGPVSKFRSYYVGPACIDSVSFGEQEVDLLSLWSRRGSPLSLAYAKKAFDKAGFTVNGRWAYYDLSGEGVKWDLRDMPKEEFENCIN